MNRWMAFLMLVAACQAAPDRLDPSDYPGAIADEDILPPTNNCKTRAFGFDLEARGYLEGKFGGFGTYRSVPTSAFVQGDNIATDFIATSIELTACDGGPTPIDVHITLLDTDQTTTGEWRVSPYVAAKSLAQIPPGRLPLVLPESPIALFSYTDTTRADVPVRCDIQTEGVVRIDRIDRVRVRGTIDVIAGCIDADLERAHEVAQPTRFQGWFEAGQPVRDALP